jgi:exopolysaccharide biosynthesis polyprenyl glycosylphosphotransferase
MRSSLVESDTLGRDYVAPDLLPAPRRTRLLRQATARHAARLARAGLLSDAVMLAIATALSLAVPGANSGSAVWPLAFSGLVLAMFAVRGVYAPRLRLRLLDDLRTVVSVTAIAAMAVTTARVLLGEGNDFAPEAVYHWLFATVLIGTGRTVLMRTEARSRRRGETVQRALILGAGKVGRLTARRLLDEPEMGLRPIGFLDADPLEAESGSTPLPVFGAIPELRGVIEQQEVQHVIVTFSKAPHDVLLEAVRDCRRLGVAVSILPRLFEVEGERATVEHLGSLPLVAVAASNPRGLRFKAKYAFERTIAAMALLVSLPLLVAAAVAVRLTMGGPVFFRQHRVGADGRQFEMLKLRTMKGDPEQDEEADIDWALEQLATNGANLAADEQLAAIADRDDRRTRLGRLLRRFSLDELPQLLNVVRGEMSLVGPRPERVSYVRRFERSIYRYSDRHRVKSGITGWAQVNGLRGKTSLSDRVEWDNYYIENWSFWLDVKIVLMTIACVLRGQHEDPNA